MGIRLINRDCTNRTLTLSKRTWFGLLEIGLVHGWNPLGAVHADGWLEAENFFHPADEPGWGYSGEDHRLVLFEDALNLADALEAASLDFEPEWEHYLDWGEATLSGSARLVTRSGPSLGSMLALVEFCRLGPFQIQHSL